jgi:predicted nucleotidyltransferase
LSAPPLRLRELLQRLVEAEIRFVLVGGLAVNAWGYLRGTRDVDMVPDPVEVGGRLLDSTAISTFLKTGDRTLVLTELGQIDVLQGLPQVPRYEELEAQAQNVDLEGLTVRVCSLEHLLAMKRASDRPRDLDDLEALEAAQEEGGDEG